MGFRKIKTKQKIEKIKNFQTNPIQYIDQFWSGLVWFGYFLAETINNHFQKVTIDKPFTETMFIYAESIQIRFRLLTQTNAIQN